MAEQWHAPGVIEPASFGDGSADVSIDEIFDFMAPPGDYLLVGGKVNFEHKSFNAELRVDNLLNNSYRQYTNRLRYFGDAPGRNLSISVGVNF